MNSRLDMAIILEIPFEEIESRVLDRWVHVPSGRTYSSKFNRPIIPDRDDETGELLVRRHDDNAVGLAW